MAKVWETPNHYIVQLSGDNAKRLVPQLVWSNVKYLLFFEKGTLDLDSVVPINIVTNMELPISLFSQLALSLLSLRARDMVEQYRRGMICVDQSPPSRALISL
jgi:hypothetical protein